MKLFQNKMFLKYSKKNAKEVQIISGFQMSFFKICFNHISPIKVIIYHQYLHDQKSSKNIFYACFKKCQFSYYVSTQRFPYQHPSLQSQSSNIMEKLRKNPGQMCRCNKKEMSCEDDRRQIILPSSCFINHSSKSLGL